MRSLMRETVRGTRWRPVRVGAAVAAAVLLLSSCAGGSSGGDGSGAADLVIWSDAPRAPLVQKIATRFEREYHVSVTVQSISKDVQTTFVTATNAGKGPDVVVGASDWIGNLVQNGSVAPLPLSTSQLKAFQPVAAKAVTYDNSVYGVPYATENLALYRRTDLVPDAPTSFEQLAAAGKRLVAQGKAQVPLAVQTGQTGDVYHMEPFYTSAGGYLFGTKRNGDYDPRDVGIGTAAGVKAATTIGKWGEKGANVFRRSVDADNSISLFAQGKAPFLVSGPWAVPTVKQAGVKYALSSVPGFAGQQPARPFVSVQAFFVSSKSQHTPLAQEFAATFTIRPDIEKALFSAEPRPPALTSVYTDVARTSQDVRGFFAAGRDGQVLPQIPAMTAVYDTLGKAEAAIVGGADPADTIRAAGTQIKTSIGR